MTAKEALQIVRAYQYGYSEEINGKTEWMGGHSFDLNNVTVDVIECALKKQIPVKPTETTDKAWGIAVKQAVCPVCNYYLPHVEFLGDFSGGRRITYCDTCGQAIDWEGWEDE